MPWQLAALLRIAPFPAVPPFTHALNNLCPIEPIRCDR